jgi:hypothetical protein
MGANGQLHASAALLLRKYAQFPFYKRQVNSTASLNIIEQMKIFYSYREPNPDSSVVQPVA